MNEIVRDLTKRFNLAEDQKRDDAEYRFVLEISPRGLSLQDKGQPRTQPLQ